MVTREVWIRDDAGRPVRRLTIIETEPKTSLRPWVVIAGISILSVAMFWFAFGKVFGL